MNTGRAVRLLILCVGLSAGSPARAGLGHHGHTHPPCPPPCIPCYTLYRTGEDPGDLQVHIRGASFNLIEIYFKEERFARYAVPDNINLCAYGRIILAPKNEFGTFAIAYGHSGFTAFGWSGSRIVPLTNGQNVFYVDGTPHVVRIDPAYPIVVEWVTTRILRITHGPGCSQESVFRFDGDARPWKVLHDGPVGSN
ncbi:hypothetical protein V5E97_25795 [Singulisphaera sp. Ch08]|uniref:Uncharacterized protein n=1 Tax=Singulisphaera sp. Ch08 TaxID=3120278 RepID=A0AAU7C9E7_9BACT